MKVKTAITASLIFFTFGAAAQDCTLGLGGTDPDQIIGAFQLDPGQQEKLQVWVEALGQENEPLQKKLDSLLAAHPQRTPEELTALGQKYENIKEQMVANSASYDRLLLGIFRPQQYRVYIAMCREVARLPLQPASMAILKAVEPRN